MVSKVGPCSEVSFKSPLGVCTWAQGTGREDAVFPLELQASSRPPASRGRNAQDQLSAGPRPPFRGAPRTGPSSTAELTGSVCPTGRAAPTKNSPAQGGLLPARARATAVGVGAGTARGTLGSARTPGPDPRRPRPRAQRWRHRCRGGRQVRRRPGWALGARPPERSPGPPCRCWGLPRARSAGTRSAAEVRPGARHRGPPPPPRSSPPGYSQSPGARRGGPRHPRVSGIGAKRTLVNSPAKRSQKPSPSSGLKCFHRGKWGDEICVGQGT